MKSQQKKLYEKKQYTNNTTNLKEVVVKGNVDNKLNQDLVLFAQFLLIARLISFHIFIFLHIGFQSLFTSYFISATHCTSTEKKNAANHSFFWQASLVHLLSRLKIKPKKISQNRFLIQ